MLGSVKRNRLGLVSTERTLAELITNRDSLLSFSLLASSMLAGNQNEALVL